MNEVSGLTAQDIGCAFQITVGARGYFLIGSSKQETKTWLLALVKAKKVYADGDVPDSPPVTKQSNPLRMRSSGLAAPLAAAAAVLPTPTLAAAAAPAPLLDTPQDNVRTRRVSTAVARNMSDDYIAAALTDGGAMPEVETRLAAAAAASALRAPPAQQADPAPEIAPVAASAVAFPSASATTEPSGLLWSLRPRNEAARRCGAVCCARSARHAARR